MFVVVIWSCDSGMLYLVCDGVGKKLLYFYYGDGFIGFVFEL